MNGGLLGVGGHQKVSHWASPAVACSRAAQLVAAHRSTRTEIVRNPHHDEEWAQAIVRSPRLVGAVRDLLGPDIAVENTFLVIKWPGCAFEIPWHQDGINNRIELDPQRSVAAWLALTDAPLDSGCLHILAGSQRDGYLPYETENATGSCRGRALASRIALGTQGLPIPVAAGDGLLMDVRLLHCSHSNRSEGARVGLNIRYVAPDAVRTRDGSNPSLHPVSGTGW
ncbi:phytanoyl-CoA dioxygenase family protein [Streptomyces sp. NPDC050658]|uniref:phytanoyl-CoA dioxygenase family protein n=1 Tax=unclassified Streptomyces TaxID=2593676 RepID=UPI0034165299